MQKYKIINAYKINLLSFYPNDCEAGKIVVCSKGSFTMFDSKKEAEDYLDYMWTEALKNSDRWGEDTTDTIKKFISLCSVVKVK